MPEAGERLPRGARGCAGGRSGGQGGTGPDWVWPAQIPGTGSNLASLGGCHLTPGAQPCTSQDQTAWPWTGAAGQEHAVCSGPGVGEGGPRQEGSPYQPAGRSHQGGRLGRWGLEGFFKEEILLNVSNVPSGSLPPSSGSCSPYVWSPAALLAWQADSSVLPTGPRTQQVARVRVRARASPRPWLWADGTGCCVPSRCPSRCSGHASLEASVLPAGAATLPPEPSGGGEDKADSVGHQTCVGAIQSNLTHSAYHLGWRGYYNTHFTDE